VYRIPSIVIILCLAFSFVESFGAEEISNIQSKLPSGVRRLKNLNSIYSLQSQSHNEVQNIRITVYPLKYNSNSITEFNGTSSTQSLKPSDNPMKTDTIKKEVFHYTHDTALSTAAKIMKGSSEFVGLRFGIEKLVETGAYPKIAYLPPSFIYSKKEVNTLIFQKRKVWTIKPKSAKKQVILYVHGGGYVANLSLIHWDFIQEVVEKTNSIMVVPDYPLSPDFTYKELFHFMDELYSWISRAYPDCEIIFMGDSAGGGLSLAYAQLIQIRNQEIEDKINNSGTQSYHWKAPQKVILLSPWLDLGMKNPEAKPIAELDKILSFEVLKLCAQAYLGNKKPSDELLKMQQVSPINGPFLNNTEIAVFVGTHDLFFADSKKLKNQYSEFARSANSEFSGFQFYEYPQMFHVWMLFTKLPESQSVISQITEFLGAE